MNELSFIRKNLRSKRRSLSPLEQKKAQLNVLHHLNSLAIFHSSKKIGLYLHAFGEVHTDLIIKLCFQKNKQVYLPMICSINQRLVWVRISKNQYVNRRFSHHPLGMKEPMATRGKHVSKLDLLLMPLRVLGWEGAIMTVHWLVQNISLIVWEWLINFNLLDIL